MRTGRPIKPDHMHELDGTRKRSPRRKTAKADDCRFGIPKGLPAQVRQRVLAAVRHFEKNKMSKDCDRSAFDRYCQHLHLAHDAYVSMKKEGTTTTDERGLIRKHPAAQIWKDNSLAALKFEEQFGMTPLARGKVPIDAPPEKTKSALEKLLDAKKQAGQVPVERVK